MILNDAIAEDWGRRRHAAGLAIEGEIRATKDTCADQSPSLSPTSVQDPSPPCNHKLVPDSSHIMPHAVAADDKSVSATGFYLADTTPRSSPSQGGSTSGATTSPDITIEAGSELRRNGRVGNLATLGGSNTTRP
jgi:hypothetical protein